MKLQDQVCTLEQAKRLKDLGVKQKSLFYWHPSFEPPVFGEKWTTVAGKQYQKSLVCNDKKGSASAFSVAELGVMLPRYYPAWRCLEEGGQNEFWIATIIGQPEGYEREKEDVYDIRTVAAFDRYGKTQAEAQASLLISLLETKTITAEEVNKRLET